MSLAWRRSGGSTGAPPASLGHGIPPIPDLHRCLYPSECNGRPEIQLGVFFGYRYTAAFGSPVTQGQRHIMKLNRYERPTYQHLPLAPHEICPGH